MNTTLTAGLVLICLLAAVGMGMWLRRLLPEHHLIPDSRDTVKLTVGLIATLSAVLLGLLVSSSKTSYETTHTQVIQLASKFRLLDRVLEIYGTQAAGVRGELRALVEDSTRHMWPVEAGASVQAPPTKLLGDAYYLALLKLEAHDDTERALKAQAVSLMVDVAQLRSLIRTESSLTLSRDPPRLEACAVDRADPRRFPHTRLATGSQAGLEPGPLRTHPRGSTRYSRHLCGPADGQGFSLLAPSNGTTTLALIASAVCTAGAILLLLELNQPFDGLMRIPSEPMRQLLAEIGK